MNKKTFILLLVSNTVLNTHCMLKQYKKGGLIHSKYEPHIQSNVDVVFIRKATDLLCQFDDLLQQKNDKKITKKFKKLEGQCISKLISDNYVYSIEHPIKEEQNYDCRLYAFAKTIGFKDNITVELESLDHSSLQIFKYFKETNSPKIHDLVIYSTNNEDLETQHVGIFINENYIKSKWGTTSYIVNHGLFYVPSCYGNCVRFFTLKNKFYNVPKELLIALIKHDVDENAYLLKCKLRDALLKYCEFIAYAQPSKAMELVNECISTLDLMEKHEFIIL